jgi:hypothetical protein
LVLFDHAIVVSILIVVDGGKSVPAVPFPDIRQHGHDL